MKTKKKLLISLLMLSAFSLVNAQTLDFTVVGTAASYIKWNNASNVNLEPYQILKTNSAIVVDGVEEAAWNNINAKVVANITHEGTGGVVDLGTYPQTEAYAKATFKALWTVDGVYMFIHVLDNNIVYQNPSFQWENDGIEFYFAKAVGEGKIQIIIPAMVGLKNPAYAAGPDFESGSATGSNAAYKVFGYDAANWDASTFSWAVKKTAVGYDMEVYLDKDIATNGNSMTNYGLDKIFAGDINLDVAGTKKNSNSPSLFVRECSLALLGSSSQEYANSNYYGLFKLVESYTGVNEVNVVQFNAIYNPNSKEIKINSNEKVLISVFNIAGQVMPIAYNNETISVSKLKQGIYIIKAVGITGISKGTQKLVIY